MSGLGWVSVWEARFGHNSCVHKADTDYFSTNDVEAGMFSIIWTFEDYCQNVHIDLQRAAIGKPAVAKQVSDICPVRCPAPPGITDLMYCNAARMQLGYVCSTRTHATATVDHARANRIRLSSHVSVSHLLSAPP